MTEPGRAIVNLRPVAEPELRLICIPYAGGGAAVYRPWRDDLPTGVELWSLRMPGRESRYHERPFRRLGPLVDVLVDELAPHLDVPFALFGHSLGALTAFELARRFEQNGRPARHLFVSAHRAPHLPLQHVPVHLAPDSVLLERLREYGGTPEGFFTDPALVAAVLPSLRADLAITETYRYDAALGRLGCPMTALGGATDAEVLSATVLAWEHVAGGPFDVRLFDGGHFYWTDDAGPLLAVLRSRLSEVSAAC